MADRGSYLIRAVTSAGFTGALALLALRYAYLTLEFLFGPAMAESQ